jgi:hypothetical protein
MLKKENSSALDGINIETKSIYSFFPQSLNCIKSNSKYLFYKLLVLQSEIEIRSRNKVRDEFLHFHKVRISRPAFSSDLKNELLCF